MSESNPAIEDPRPRSKLRSRLGCSPWILMDTSSSACRGRPVRSSAHLCSGIARSRLHLADLGLVGFRSGVSLSSFLVLVLVFGSRSRLRLKCLDSQFCLGDDFLGLLKGLSRLEGRRHPLLGLLVQFVG